MDKKKHGPYEFKDGRIIKRTEESEPLTPSRMFIEGLVKEEDEADNAEALENAKTNFDRRRAREITARVSIVFIITAFMLFLLITFGFQLKNVNVSGMTVYSPDEIAEWVNENAADNVLLMGTSDLEDKLSAAFPKLKNVSVEKDFPNAVTVTAEDDSPVYYITLDGEHYILSEDLKVISRTTDVSLTKELLAVEIKDIKKAVTGDILEFYYDYQYDYIKDLLTDIITHDISHGVISVDADDKFDIKINYDGRFTVMIGVGENVKTKLTLAKAYIDSLPDGEKGIIDSTSTEKGSYISLMK